MFNKWVDAKKAYNLVTVRYTYIKNWNQHKGIKNFINLIDSSTLDSVKKINDKLIEVSSAKLNLNSIFN